MLFNSLDFALFLPLVFFVYWFFLKNNFQFQNIFLVLASYVFYGWWDWRFLILIAISSLADFLIANKISNQEKSRSKKGFLYLSLFLNLGLLGVFKYYNFFIESFGELLNSIGLNANYSTLNLILPVGISFYTFQTLSYTIDVYRGKISATKNLPAFFAFVSFFPQLVAGPIERAKYLLPQFLKPRSFDIKKACDGLRQILWGLFKKIVIADNCAIYVNQIFSEHEIYSGSTLLLGSILFAFGV